MMPTSVMQTLLFWPLRGRSKGMVAPLLSLCRRSFLSYKELVPASLSCYGNCRNGDLLHKVGSGPYSSMTLPSFLCTCANARRVSQTAVAGLCSGLQLMECRLSREVMAPFSCNCVTPMARRMRHSRTVLKDGMSNCIFMPLMVRDPCWLFSSADLWDMVSFAPRTQLRFHWVQEWYMCHALQRGMSRMFRTESWLPSYTLERRLCQDTTGLFFSARAVKGLGHLKGRASQMITPDRCRCVMQINLADEYICCF